jgi:hypothetical protein
VRVPGYSHPRELPLDCRHLSLAVADLLRALGVSEAPLSVIPVVVKHLEDKTPKGVPADVVHPKRRKLFHRQICQNRHEKAKRLQDFKSLRDARLSK